MRHVQFLCPRCGASFRFTETSLPVNCCNVSYRSLDDLPTKEKPEIPPHVLDGGPPGQPDYAVENGVGWFLAEIFKSLNITSKMDCGCDALMRSMNRWGPAGCRQRLPDIVAQLEKHAKRYGWRDRVSAAGHAAKNGLALKINWFDPFPGLVTEAIERCESVARASLGSGS